MNYDYIILQDTLKAFNASFHILFCASAVLPSRSVRRESALFFYAFTKLDISLNTYPDRHLPWNSREAKLIYDAGPT